MPLHNTEELKAAPTSQLETEVLDEGTAKYEFPETPQDPHGVYQTIHNQLILDGNSQQNLVVPQLGIPLRAFVTEAVMEKLEGSSMGEEKLGASAEVPSLT